MDPLTIAASLASGGGAEMRIKDAEQNLIRARHELKCAAEICKDAEQNLIWARHDFVDATVGYISENANDWRQRLGADNLQKHFPEYGALFGLLKTMLDTIALSRAERVVRNEVYETMMREDLPRLQNLHRAMVASVPAIQENIKKESGRNFYFMLFRIAKIIIVIAGIAIEVFI